MPILSSLFNSDSSNEDSSSFLGGLTGNIGLNVSNESYSNEVDADGSSETNWDATSIGTEIDLGSILSSMSDSFSDSDSGGLLG